MVTNIINSYSIAKDYPSPVTGTHYCTVSHECEETPRPEEWMDYCNQSMSMSMASGSYCVVGTLVPPEGNTMVGG